MRLYFGFLTCLVLGFSTAASSQDREGSWDVGFHVIDMSSESINGVQGSPITDQARESEQAKMEKSVRWGIAR